MEFTFRKSSMFFSGLPSTEIIFATLPGSKAPTFSSTQQD